MKRFLLALAILPFGTTSLTGQAEDTRTAPTPVVPDQASTPVAAPGATLLIVCSASANVWLDGIQMESCLAGHTVTVSTKPGKHAVRAQSLESPTANWLEIVDVRAGTVTTVGLDKGGKTSTHVDDRKPGVQSGALSQAPKGFQWEQATKIKAAFLKPDGWFFRVEEKPKTIAYFVSREDSHVGKFRVGLTVNVNRVTSGNGVEYARKILTEFPRSPGKKLHRSWEINDAGLSGGGCEVEFDDIVMQVVILANPRTGLVYINTFEAPKAEWAEAWRVGQEIMSHLVFDPDL